MALPIFFSKNRATFLHNNRLRRMGDIWTPNDGFILVELASIRIGLNEEESSSWLQLCEIFLRPLYLPTDLFDVRSLAS